MQLRCSDPTLVSVCCFYLSHCLFVLGYYYCLHSSICGGWSSPLLRTKATALFGWGRRGYVTESCSQSVRAKTFEVLEITCLCVTLVTEGVGFLCLWQRFPRRGAAKLLRARMGCCAHLLLESRFLVPVAKIPETKSWHAPSGLYGLIRPFALRSLCYPREVLEWQCRCIVLFIELIRSMLSRPHT